MYLDILQFNLYPFIIFMSGLLTLNFKEVRKCAKLCSCLPFIVPHVRPFGFKNGSFTILHRYHISIR